MKKAVIFIDVQNDFVKGGVLSFAYPEEDNVPKIVEFAKVSIAEAYAKGLGQVKMPMVINSGSGNSAPSDALKTFFDLKSAALALEMSENSPKTK